MSKPTIIKKCCYCGKGSNLVKMTREHLIPISKGGSHHKSNIRPCCGRCNTHRKNKDLYLWRIEIKNMLINRDYILFSCEELLRVVKNIESIQLVVNNSTPSMWYSGKVGVIEKPRKIKTYG
jgi:5-methylcytosine-specific restriction endonuclease McrA